jgi:hypothetical protein
MCGSADPSFLPDPVVGGPHLDQLPVVLRRIKVSAFIKVEKFEINFEGRWVPF